MQTVGATEAARYPSRAFRPGCLTIGGNPWCAACSEFGSTFRYAITSLAREERLRAVARIACSRCQERSCCNMELCQNHVCCVKKASDFSVQPPPSSIEDIQIRFTRTDLQEINFRKAMVFSPAFKVFSDCEELIRDHLNKIAHSSCTNRSI